MHPFHLIGRLNRFGHALVPGQLIHNKFNAFIATVVDLGQVFVQLAGQQQAGIPSAPVLFQISLSQQPVLADGRIFGFEAEIGGTDSRRFGYMSDP